MVVFFKNKDGLKLVGVLTTPKNKTTTCIILCHGATVDKEESGVFTELAQELTKAGFAAFRFDFRGHGKSEGNSTDMTVNGQKKDIEAAYSFLLKKGYKKFGLIAASFSGGSATLFVISHQDKVNALIYWNSVLEYKSLLKRWLSEGERGRLRDSGFIIRDKTRYGKKLIGEISKLEPWRKLREIKIPTLFIHGDRDSHVPYKDSVRFAKLLNTKLETIHGSEHGFHTKKGLKQATNIATTFFLDKFKQTQ